MDSLLYLILHAIIINLILFLVRQKRHGNAHESVSISVVYAFVDAINKNNSQWATYLADRANLIIDPDASIHVTTIADFVQYAQQVQAEFTITNIKQKNSIITCTVHEQNHWLFLVFSWVRYFGYGRGYKTIFPTSFEVNTWLKIATSKKFESTDFRIIFKMKTSEQIASITLSVNRKPIDSFLFALEDWLRVNNNTNAHTLFTHKSQLIFNKQNGAAIVELTGLYLKLMQQLLGLYLETESAYKKGDYETAVFRFTDVLILKPGLDIQYPTLLKRAAVYHKMSAYELAIADYETAVSIHKDILNPGPCNTFCWSYILTEEPEAALSCCTQAISTHPNRTAFDLRALAYAQLGQYDKAVADLQARASMALICKDDFR